MRKQKTFIQVVKSFTSMGLSGAPGLVDRVFAVHAGSRGFDSHRRHMSERFFRSNRPGYPHLVVSEWRSVIAVSLNVCGDVRLIKPAKLYMCTQTHYKHDEDGRTAPGVRGHGSVPLSHSGNYRTIAVSKIFSWFQRCLSH